MCLLGICELDGSDRRRPSAEDLVDSSEMMVSVSLALSFDIGELLCSLGPILGMSNDHCVLI